MQFFNFGVGFLIRGGAKDKQSKAKSKSKVEIRRSARYEDDDEDDDDSNYKSKGRSKKVSPKPATKSKKGSSSKKLQLIPWNDSKGKRGNAKINWKERLEQIAKQGQAAYKEVYRRAKVLRSSAFEGILLKATWPGDSPVPQEILTEIVKHSIPSFKYGRSETDDDPYYMTLHKLWTKMCEKDWRTVVKSLYILHCISRDCSAEDCGHFAVALRDMSKTRNPKRPDHKYFDQSMITELDTFSEPFEGFVKAYASFVLFRAKWFSAKFEELKDVPSSTVEKKAVALIKKTQQLISLGLRCAVSGKDQINLITGYSTRHIANDLRDLYKFHGNLIAPFVSNDNTSHYASPKLSAEEIKQLVSYHSEVGGQISDFLEKTSKNFAKIRIKISPDLQSSDSRLTPEKLAARLQELASLSGGFCSARRSDADSAAVKRRPSWPTGLLTAVKKKAVEESEEEEEEEEEEGTEDDEDDAEEEGEEEEEEEEGEAASDSSADDEQEDKTDDEDDEEGNSHDKDDEDAKKEGEASEDENDDDDDDDSENEKEKVSKKDTEKPISKKSKKGSSNESAEEEEEEGDGEEGEGDEEGEEAEEEEESEEEEGDEGEDEEEGEQKDGGGKDAEEDDDEEEDEEED